jgi:putative cell wall-binding protein
LRIRTQRSTKRSFAALIAAAMIASVLALVAAPAAAITPKSGDTTTKLNARVSGTDRYDTAGEAADAYLGRRGTLGTWNSVVVVSGENYPDALAASSLAGALTAPIIMLPSDGSMPSKVRDWAISRRVQIQGNSTSTAPFTIYAIGGTSALPQSGIDALVAVLGEGDTTPAVSKRISGADRYATAAAVAGYKNSAGGYVVLDSSDTMFIASGNSFADALSASPHLFNASDPIVLTPSSGLGADAKAQIKAWKTLGGTSVVILGGTAAVSDQVITDIVNGTTVTYNNIRRIHGADRYATSVEINTWIIANNANFDGSLQTLVNGQTFADGLAGAPFMGFGGNNAAYLAALTDGTSLSAKLSAKIASLSKTGKPSNIYALGGVNAVSAATVTAAIDAAKAVDAAAVATLTCVELNTSGAQNVTLSITGNLTATGTGATSEIALVTAAQLTINGISSSIAATSQWGDTTGNGTEDTAPAYSAVTGKTTGILYVPANSLDAGDLITWAGLTEASNTATINRAIAGTSCTVANDTTGPSVTSIQAVVGGSDNCSIGGTGSPCVAVDAQTATYVVNFSEAITASTFTTADISGTMCVDEEAAGADTDNDNVITPIITAIGTSGKSFKVEVHVTDAAANVAAEVGILCVIEAGETIIINTTGITDRSTNAGTTTKTKTMHATLDADVSAPVFTSSVACTQASATTLKRDILTATATATGGSFGVEGNTYSMKVVNSRGLVIPTVVIVGKVITVTADLAYTTTEDIAAVAVNNGVSSKWTFGRSGGTALDKIGTDAVTTVNAGYLSAGSTAGVQACTLKLTPNERLRIEKIGTAVTASIVFGGAQLVAASAATFSTTGNTVSFASMAPALPVTAQSVSYTLNAAWTDLKGNASAVAGSN